LFRIVVPVQGRSFSRLKDDDENLRCPGIRPVNYQIIDMRRKPVTFHFGRGKYILHKIAMTDGCIPCAGIKR
jgi:hypothetical protein